MKLADVVFATILMNMLSSQAFAGATCESLASLSLPDTTITVAQTVAGALRLRQLFQALVLTEGSPSPQPRIFQSFAGSLELRSPPKTPKSSSKFGCPLQLERQLYGSRQRRYGRIDQLRKHVGTSFLWLYNCLNRCRAREHGTRRELRARPWEKVIDFGYVRPMK
jgi:hypothetical protein